MDKIHMKIITIMCNAPKTKATELSQKIYTMVSLFVEYCTFTPCTSAFVHLFTNLFVAYLTTLLVAR
jgi:hypothetical protein